MSIFSLFLFSHFHSHLSHKKEFPFFILQLNGTYHSHSHFTINFIKINTQNKNDFSLSFLNLKNRHTLIPCAFAFLHSTRTQNANYVSLTGGKKSVKLGLCPPGLVILERLATVPKAQPGK